MEYLLLTAFAILVALIAVAALMQILQIVQTESSFLSSYADKVVEVLLS